MKSRLFRKTPTLASRAYKIRKEDGLLDLAAPAEENWNKYRAYADSIGTYFMQNGKRMKITSAEFAKGVFRVLRVIPEGKARDELSRLGMGNVKLSQLTDRNGASASMPRRRAS